MRTASSKCIRSIWTGLGLSIPNMAGTGTEDVYTLGTRFTTAPKPFDFDVEGDYQLGSFKSDDINAYSFATKDGYTFSGVILHPRVYFGFRHRQRRKQQLRDGRNIQPTLSIRAWTIR